MKFFLRCGLFFVLIGFFLLSACHSSHPVESPPQEPAVSSLREKIKTVTDTMHGIIGVGIAGLDFRDTFLLHTDHHFPMQSVYKVPLAMAILDRVDNGQLSLKQVVHIPKEKPDKNTWSPMLKDFPDQDLDLTVAELLRYSVSKSDNNACDILFGLAGGTDAVEQFVHQLGIKDISIAATEAEMKKSWPVQYTNWCTPAAMLELLRLLYERKVLSESSNNFLLELMTQSENSPKRIKGLLPDSTMVAHKTGTSGKNEAGMIAATNDVGIVTLPGGRHFAIVVFVSDYTGGYEKGERAIAEIARMAWEHFEKK